MYEVVQRGGATLETVRRYVESQGTTETPLKPRLPPSWLKSKKGMRGHMFNGIPEAMQHLLFSMADLSTRSCADYARQEASAQSLFLILRRQGYADLANVLQAFKALDHLPRIKFARLLETAGPAEWRG